ncbi:DUF475 domain-containing protein [Kineococcus sp. SYSU DK005]|uniref:DUF475 domain-containing protein n=1 Tax=Kineococcus sp. SYSU DK005 TaxID=3383126 RepID=UPI003D7EE4E2
MPRDLPGPRASSRPSPGTARVPGARSPWRPAPAPGAAGRTGPGVLRVPLALLLVGAAGAWWLDGPPAAAALVTLAAYEIALSADSAVPMAGVAGRLHQRAKQVFLAAGLLAGVIVMRLVAPPVVVSASARETPAQVVDDVITDPGAYAAELSEIRPGLAGFGGVFLWLVFTEFLLNCERKDRPAWIGPLERPLLHLRRPRAVQAAVAVALAALAAALAPADRRGTVALAGALGLAAYALVKLVALRTAPPATGWWRAAAHGAAVVFERALAVFMLLEVLDGTYSFTGGAAGLPPWERLGIAAAGVGVGAVFLVQLTRHLDARSALSRYEHLPAGAAYVLGVLAVLLWVSLLRPVPSAVAGWFGGVVIGAALLSSLVRARRRAAPATPAAPTAPAGARAGTPGSRRTPGR